MKRPLGGRKSRSTACWRSSEGETERQRDRETERQRDRETERQRDGRQGGLKSPVLLLSLSLCPSVPLSPLLPVSPSLCMMCAGGIRQIGSRRPGRPARE